MAGYANRIVRLTFPELTEPDESELFIVIKNPRTLPPEQLMADDVALDAQGNPTDPKRAIQRTKEVIAPLILAWRMYDATVIELDDDGKPKSQPPLPMPATPELVGKLPTEAIVELNRIIAEAVNPR